MAFYENYKGKAIQFSIAQDMLDKRLSTDGIDMFKLIRQSNTKGEFRQHVKKSLYFSERTDVYDFSLMMGLQFGVFNFYCYQDIDKTLKKKFIICNPTPKKTAMLFQNHGDSILLYLNQQYGILEQDAYNIVKRMFHLNNDNLYYHEEVVENIGKLVISYFLYFTNKKLANNPYVVNHFLESGRALSYFKECNYTRKVKY